MSEEMSKSAKKRAAAKARAAAAAAEAEPAPAPAPEPKAKAKAEAKAKPKADAKPKAEPEPKAKAKAKAEPKPEPKAEAKPAAKAAGKASSKKKAAPAPAPEPPKPKEVENTSHIQVDDGTGGEWAVASNVSMKNQRRQQRKAEEAAMTKQEKAVAQVNQSIPGMASTPAASSIVGAAKVSQSVSAKLAVVEPAKAAEPAKEGEPAKEKLDSLTVKVPEKMIGRVIGPKGANLKLIQEKTGIERIDTNGELFTISGKTKEAQAAHAALTELVEKGYMSLAFDNFAEIGCMAHPSTFPDIIGTKGAIIIKLKEELKVEINIPPVPKGTTGPKKYKIGIAGSKEASEKAQKCIEDIIMYGHSEVTHPGLVHEELEVPSWAYSYIIGKGGSELRHIQKNWNVKVNIPRDYSENDKVVVVGEPRDVARAKEYIEKQVDSAGNQSSGREGADKADDYWGAEGDNEPWMEQYMYKRK